MNRLRIFFVVAFAASLCISLDSCKSGSADNGQPQVLHYAFSPQMEQLQGGALRIDLIRNYLQSQLHIPVKIVLVEGYGPTIEAMRADKVDMISGSSMTYIMAAQKAGAEAIAARGFPGNRIGGYRSIIAVPRNSPYHSLADLKAHAKDVVFAFSAPTSTSGYLYPRVGLQDAGIDPDTDFKKLVFSGNDLASIMTLRAGKVDAAASFLPMLNYLIAHHNIAVGDVRVIWTSELIPIGPYSVRKALPEELKKKVQAALIEMPTKDPKLWANLNSMFHTPDEGTMMIPVNDATYNGLRRTAAQVKDFNFSEK